MPKAPALLSTSSVLISLTVSLIGLFVSWIKDLGLAARQTRLQARFTNSTQFWTSWIEAIQKIRPLSAGEQEMAEAELSRIVSTHNARMPSLMPSVEWTAGEFAAYKRGINPLRRLLMLYRQPSRSVRLFLFFGFSIIIEPIVYAVMQNLPLNQLYVNLTMHFWGKHLGLNQFSPFNALTISITCIPILLGFSLLLEKLYVLQLDNLELMRRQAHELEAAVRKQGSAPISGA